MGMAVYDYFSSLLLTDAELKSGWQHVFVVNPNFSEDEMYHIYVADSENRGMFELQKKHGNVTAFVQQVYVTHFRAGIFSPR